jgi:hypothetical protein
MQFGLAGLAGSLIALIADVIQKELASSVVKISSSLSVVLKLPITPLWTLLILAVIAAAYCAFKTKALGEAFAVGLGILSVIMTITPYRAAPTLPSAPSQELTSSGAGLTPAINFTSDRAGLLRVQFASDSHAREILPTADRPLRGVKIRLLFPSEGKPSEKVTLEVFKAASGQKIGTLATEGSQFNFGLEPGDYDIRITAPGYQIIDDKLTVRGDTGKDVTLKKSAVPLPLQRLLVPAR